MKQQIRNHRAGFTLTELAVVLGITGILFGAIWTASKSVSDSSRATQATQDIMTIADNIRSTYIGASSFGPSGPSNVDQTATYISTGGIFPADLLVGSPATATRNAWGGTVQVFSYAGGNTRRFRITYNQISQDACFRVASQLANLGTSSQPVNLITNGGAVTQIPNVGATVGLSSTAITAACNANVGSANPMLGFDFTIN